MSRACMLPSLSMSNPVSPSSRAVFLSYAKQDSAAAKGICDALRAAGIEVWFDQSELRGGDAWDQQIRRQIKECALFIPVISAHTQTRAEGYFRLEWHLAEQRTYLMAHDQAFLVPVVVDDTPDSAARVPERFRERQWTRLPGGAATGDFCDRVRRLLHLEDGAAVPGPGMAAAAPAPAPLPVTAVAPAPKRSRLWILPVCALLAAACALALFRSWRPAAAPAQKAVAPSAASEKSVAVLAFANMSEDRDNEYFSDGISDELLTVLQRVPGLKVAARASSFSFKGKSATAQEMGEKLGVANLVEGSVQKSGNRVRIIARLSRVSTGEELWSQSYTRELKDVFALEDEVAQAIVGELRGHLPGAEGPAPEGVFAAAAGGTSNPDAHQLFLQGKFFGDRFTEVGINKSIGFYERATQLDPSYALAWAWLAEDHIWICGWGSIDRAEFEHHLAQARTATERALELAPDLPVALLAQVDLQYNFDFDMRGAAATLVRALKIAPDNPDLLTAAAILDLVFGRRERAIERAARAVALDPVNPEAHHSLAIVLWLAGDYVRAHEEYARATELSPDVPLGQAGMALSDLLQGHLQEAEAEAKKSTTEWSRLYVLSLVYVAEGRAAEADAALKNLIRTNGDIAAFQIAEIFSKRGETDKAFTWLERARAQHDPGLVGVGIDPFMTALHADSRWQALVRSVGQSEEQLR